MHVRALFAERFRNLRQIQFEPHPRFTVLSGENGQGKTNVLEAIYMLATLRSFRTARPGAVDELIQLGERSATVRARVERQQVERQLAVQLMAQGPVRKDAFVDGKAARAGDYFGGVNAVLFAPDDLRLPKGPPVQRRRFLDRAVWNTCPPYLKEVQTYERILKSRNALLRSEGRTGAPPPGVPIDELLPVYDQQLAAAGAVLIYRRTAYLRALAPRISAAFERVSRSGLSVAVRYQGSIPVQEAASAEEVIGRSSEALRERLSRDERRDRARGFTHHGPHADDLDFEIGGQPAAKFASQGQLRALVLALKIAEISHLCDVLGDAPVLLLDDVSSELDRRRNEYLFEFLNEIPCQCFITTTSPGHIQIQDERLDLLVQGGSISTR